MLGPGLLLFIVRAAPRGGFYCYDYYCVGMGMGLEREREFVSGRVRGVNSLLQFRGNNGPEYLARALSLRHHPTATADKRPANYSESERLTFNETKLRARPTRWWRSCCLSRARGLLMEASLSFIFLSSLQPADPLED